MLEQSVREQLKEVFARLEGRVVLRLLPPLPRASELLGSAGGESAEKAAHAELREMLGALCEASPLLSLEEASSGAGSDAGGLSDSLDRLPGVEIWASQAAASRFSPATGEGAGAPPQAPGPLAFSGISFRGVPGGHEFSSLVLGVLYADGKGKRPDPGVVARVRALRGPIRLRTFISQSCENCPEVVQALQLMATFHPDFRHEMVDGALAQDEVARLGIQGVPSVVVDGKLLHSGKSGFLELLLKLEAHFGKSEAASGPRELGHYDVVVVGGGPAGVTAAIYSARKGLKTALIAERMGGQLQDTKGIENMISVPYTEGVELAARLSEHLARYEVQVLEHRRVGEIDRERTSAGRRVNLESGETLLADAIILATGARWRELGIPGEREHLGQGVAFCAHCDGPFYRDRRVVVVGGGNSGVEAAIDLAGIAKEVVLLEYGKALRADGVLVDKLRSLSNARIVTQAKSTRVLGEGGKVVGLEYQDLSQVGSSASADASLVQLGTDGVFVQIGLSPNTHFVAGLLELSPGGEIVVDAKGRTSVPGIYAAGDVTPIPFKQIVTALGDGAKAALTAFEDRLRS